MRAREAHAAAAAAAVAAAEERDIYSNLYRFLFIREGEGGIAHASKEVRREDVRERPRKGDRDREEKAKRERRT